MIRSGLTSVTFRKLSPREIVDLAARAGLDGIEWGGDVHVPPGQAATARHVADMTRQAGLVVSSYGSYYRVGQEEPGVFAAVLATARDLGAPIVRVWAGRVGSADADAAHRARVADDGRRIAELADRAGAVVACEWHGKTLTDTADSAGALFAAVDHPAFRTYWQPRADLPVTDCLFDLEAAMDRLAGLHVFHWDGHSVARRPLREGEAAWRAYLARAGQAGDMFALLEFVLDDDPRQMLADAATLKSWLTEANER